MLHHLNACNAPLIANPRTNVVINISEDRLRWLVREGKHLTLDGAVEIAKASPDLLREIERLRALAPKPTLPDNSQETRPDSGRRNGWDGPSPSR